MNYQAMQIAGQKNSAQANRQTQAVAQVSTEESKENSTVKSQEAGQGAEVTESKSINLYA
jgi:hypothetical protein